VVLGDFHQAQRRVLVFVTWLYEQYVFPSHRPTVILSRRISQTCIARARFGFRSNIFGEAQLKLTTVKHLEKQRETAPDELRLIDASFLRKLLQGLFLDGLEPETEGFTPPRWSTRF